VALVIDIADAVVAVLNGDDADFSQDFEAQRRVRPSFELTDLTDLRVTVVPKGFEASIASRSLSQYDVQVDVGIQKKLAAGADEEVEVATMCGLVEEVADFLKGKPLEGDGWRASWVRPAVNEPVYSTEHLAEKRVFTSVLTLTYRAMR
jgi:hypothetical protein